MKKFTRVVQFFIIATILIVGQLYAATYYVNGSTGSDAHTKAQAAYPDTAWAAIQTAIDSSSSGDTILVAAGTYTGDVSIVSKTNLTIIGAGAGNSIISPVALLATGIGHKYTPNMSVVVFVNTSSGIELNGFTVNSTSSAPGAGGADAIVFWNASSGSIINCSFTGIYTINGNQTGQGIAVDAGTGQTSNLSLLNTSISGFQKNGIDAIDGNGSGSNPGTITVTVNGCLISGAGPTSAIAQNGFLVWNMGGGSVTGTVNNSSISNFDYTGVGATAAGILEYGNTSANISPITNTAFTGCQYDISAVSGANIDASTGNTFDGVNPGSASLSQLFAIEDKIDHKMDDITEGLVTFKAHNLFVSDTGADTVVQRGIDNASNGDTVNVAAGTYTENLTINHKSVSLFGPNAGIAGNGLRGSEAILTAPSGTIINIVSTPGSPLTVVINGFKFTGNAYAINDYSNSNNLVTVEDNYFYQVNDMYFETPGLLTFANNKLDYLKHADGYEAPNVQVGNNFSPGYGVVAMTGNVFTNQDTTGNGFNLYGVTGTISNNQFNNLLGFGLLIGGPSHSLTISNNTFSQINSAAYNGTGLIFYNPRTLTGNISLNLNNFYNNKNGIRIDSIDSFTSSYIQTDSNNFTGNTSYGIKNNSSTVLNATHNWWGSIQGPKAASNPSGLGDSVSTNVSYNPWIGQPTQVSVDTSDLNHQISIPGTDVSLNFTYLPDSTHAQINVSQIPTLPNGTPPPPGDSTNAVFLEITATGLTNYTFNVIVTIDVSGIPGFNDGTRVMRFNTSTNSWEVVTGTYMAHNPAFSNHPTFTFSTDHFSLYAFVTLSGLYTAKIGNITTYTGSTVFVPVKINLNGNGGFNEFQSRFLFDPSKLQYQTAFYGSGTLINQKGWVVYFQQTSPGIVDMIGLGLNPIDSVNTDSLIFKIVFRVVASTAGQTYITGDSTHFLANETPGLFTVAPDTITYTIAPPPVKGDANGDYVVDMNDIIFLQDYLDGTVTLTQQDSINADIDGNGHIDSWDMYAILYYIINGSWPTPPSPALASSGSVFFANNNYDKNGLLTLPVSIVGAQNVYRLDVLFKYDPGKISYQTFKQAVVAPGYFVNATELSKGTAEFVFTSGMNNSGTVNPGNIVLKLGDLQKAVGSIIKTVYRINGGDAMTGPSIVLGITGIEQQNEGSVIPKEFSVSQNYPNPFNPSTVINYEIPKTSFVSIKIYNMLGQEIKTLINSEKQPGTYSVQWNGDNEFGQKVASGAYIYRIVAGSYVKTMKMVLLK